MYTAPKARLKYYVETDDYKDLQWDAVLMA